MDVFGEALGFITPEQLESSVVTGVLTEVPTIDGDTTSDFESDDDYVGNDEYDDDIQFGYAEVYPQSHLVYLEPKIERKWVLQPRRTGVQFRISFLPFGRGRRVDGYQ
jgi:hypothetical protein